MSEMANAAAASLVPACFTACFPPCAQTVHEHAEVCVDAEPRGSADMVRAEMVPLAPRHVVHAHGAAWNDRHAEHAHAAAWTVAAALFVCMCVAPRAAETPKSVVRQHIAALVSPLRHDDCANMCGQARTWHSGQHQQREVGSSRRGRHPPREQHPQPASCRALNAQHSLPAGGSQIIGGPTHGDLIGAGIRSGILTGRASERTGNRSRGPGFQTRGLREGIPVVNIVSSVCQGARVFREIPETVSSDDIGLGRFFDQKSESADSGLTSLDLCERFFLASTLFMCQKWRARPLRSEFFFPCTPVYLSS